MTARITATRMAGKDHAVHTVEGGRGTYRRSPCATCPWRKDAVGEFPASAFLHAANTGTDGAHFSSDAMNTFGCHSSGLTKPATCAGYILRATDAIGWRLALAIEKFDPAKVDDCGLDLFGSYYEMAVANGVPSDDPTICRLQALASDDAP
jgi:hypothetical protein